MDKGRRYYQEYKDMIVELFKSGMPVTEISKEFEIANSTINRWINKSKKTTFCYKLHDPSSMRSINKE